MTETKTLTHTTLGGHLLIECLIAQGVTHIFGVPGESFLACLDGIYEHQDKIAFINCRQEGGAAFMAEAIGKVTGRPGVCMVTRGPGATNASIGVHTAFQDSTPMVLLVGDVGSDFRDREAFQEVNYFSMFESLAKRVERIDSANRIPEYIARAFATAMNGRPGPVVLVLPEDMQIQQVNTNDYPVLPRVESARAAISETDVQKIETLLAQSLRPLVLVGGAGWEAKSCEALEAFALSWDVPVANAFRFQDTFDNHHPNYAGDVGIGINPKLAQMVKDADVLLVIGPRLGEMTTSGYTLIRPELAHRSNQQLIHIHTSAEELGRVYQADLAINAHMESVALALAALAAPTSKPWAAWTRTANANYLANITPQALSGAVTIEAAAAQVAGGLSGEVKAQAIDMPALINILQKHLPADAVLTNGAGNFASWLHRYFQYHGMSKGVKTQAAPTVGAMGYGVPAGIGVAIAQNRVAFTIAGDGDFMMNGQELATAVHYGAKSIILVLNNGIYGTIRMHQERDYPARVAGSAMGESSASKQVIQQNFAELAIAYGYVGVRLERTEDFERELLAALARAEGTVIEILQHPEDLTTRVTLSAIRNK